MVQAFKDIDEMLGGTLTGINSDAESMAREEGFSKAYSWGKPYLYPLVGWGATDKRLNSREAYESALHALADSCWAGNEVCEARHALSRELERRGIYEAEKAAECACLRDSLANCTPERCLAWRPYDERRGYCALIGCSAEVSA